MTAHTDAVTEYTEDNIPSSLHIVNMWDNPITRRPQLIAVIMTGNGPGDTALRIREDHVNLL